MSDVSDNTEFPYPGAKVGDILCGGSPCADKTNPVIDLAMMDSFVMFTWCQM